MLEQTLQNIGFSDKKAKVYLASLEIGSAPASEIAKKAQLNRVTAYEILKILVHTGYARTYIKDKIKYFSVIKPKDLLEKQQDNINSLKNSITELENIYQKSPNKPKVSFYEGPEFLKNIYAATLENKEKVIYDITDAEKLLETLPIEYHEQYWQKRSKKGIKAKVLAPNNEKGAWGVKQGDQVNRETKLFDKKFNIPNEIIAWDDKVALASFSNKISIIIEDQEIADSIKTIWKMVWDKY